MFTTIDTYYSFQKTACCPGWIGMFRAYLGPSSGGKIVRECIQQLVLIIVVYIRFYLLMMGLDTPETFQSNQDNSPSSEKSNKYQLL